MNCSVRNPCSPTCCTCEISAGVGPKVDCSNSRAAALAVTPLLEAPTWTCRAFDVGDPAPGLITCTMAVPAAEDVPVALKLLEEMKFVVRSVALKTTWAPARKLLPLTEIVKFPTGTGLGRTADTAGRFVSNCTLAGGL